jgi:hypothetical protein
MSIFKILSIFFWFLDPNIVTKNAVRCVLRGNLLNKTQGLTFLSQNSYGRYPKDSKFQNSEYKVHQVGPKDYGSQNFNSLAFIGTELVSRQISATATATATATARDRRKKIYRSNHVF